jgi:pyruvate/2-oxoglutarate dehydrogenase complex dihydrolipoamide acyltransferase (E2) component
VAEVAMDKVNADIYAQDFGIITLLVQENTEIAQGAVIAQVS